MVISETPFQRGREPGGIQTPPKTGGVRQAAERGDGTELSLRFVERSPAGHVQPAPRHNAGTKDRSPVIMRAEDRLDRIGPDTRIASGNYKNIRAVECVERL